MKKTSVNELINAGRFLSASKVLAESHEGLLFNLTHELVDQLADRMCRFEIHENDFAERIAAAESVIRASIEKGILWKKEYSILDEDDAGVIYHIPIEVDRAVEINFAISDELASKFSDTYSNFLTLMVMPSVNHAQ
ncbi:hypothetical protein [Chromobacterium violaceum]|uniref:hypothetical protein n=1 Tax=Chromobacterium violaceum TaxID=536 RepID=UPI003CE9DC61